MTSRVAVVSVFLVIPFLSGCKKTVFTKLHVETPNFTMTDTSGATVELNSGLYNVKVEIDSLKGKPVALTLYPDGMGVKQTKRLGERHGYTYEPVKFSFPKLDLRSDVSVYSPEDLQQPFSAALLKAPQNNIEIKMEQTDSSGNSAKASIILDEALDQNKSSRSKATQKWVWPHQRGAVLIVSASFNAQIDELIKLYLAPWIHLGYRYTLIINESAGVNMEQARKQWSALIDKADVIDFFYAGHSGGALYTAKQMAKDKPLKPHQLRLAYTAGCGSGSNKGMMEEPSLQAAITVGHTGTSFSPFLFAEVIQRWVIGGSLAASVRGAWEIGKIKLNVFNIALLDQFIDINRTYDGKNLLEARRNLLNETEPMIGFTRDLPPKDAGIAWKPMVTRENLRPKEVIEIKARDIPIMTP